MRFPQRLRQHVRDERVLDSRGERQGSRRAGIEVEFAFSGRRGFPFSVMLLASSRV
jgi:hypothetical protein